MEIFGLRDIIRPMERRFLRHDGDTNMVTTMVIFRYLAQANRSLAKSFLRSIGLFGGLIALAGAVATPAAAQQDLSVASNQYILEAGDQIYIQVFDEPDLTMQATIAQSGSINYSYLGSIVVAGQTPEQLTQLIVEKLRDGYLNNPSVNITVEKYRSFFVDGEVRRPGSYGYEPGLTLAKAVSLAGGLTDRASRKKITLTREVDGEKKSFDRIKMSQSIEPGDVINVKEGFF